MDRILIDYLPPILREVREFRVLTEAEQPETESLWQYVEDALNDQFVVDATNQGVSRREMLLKITPKATESLQERKFTVLSRLSEQLPYTIAGLRRQLTSLCGENGYSVTVNHVAHTVQVRVALTAKNNFDAVCALLGRLLPANLLVDVSLKYNQNATLAAFTHTSLSGFTHEQLRNEVIR